MSAQYADARELLETVDDALVGIGRALLALGEELEALVELLRERLPVPGDDGVARIVCAAHPGFPHTITLGVEEPRVYRPAGCTCVITEPGARPYPLPDEWREGCPIHPARPGSEPNALDLVDDAECTRCGVRLSQHGPDIRDHEWIRA